jgi:hypothetical protein
MTVRRERAARLRCMRSTDSGVHCGVFGDVGLHQHGGLAAAAGVGQRRQKDQEGQREQPHQVQARASEHGQRQAVAITMKTNDRP